MAGPLGPPLATSARAVAEYLEHYHYERNHQGKSNLLLFQCLAPKPRTSNGSRVRRKERLGGLLNYYMRAA